MKQFGIQCFAERQIKELTDGPGVIGSQGLMTFDLLHLPVLTRVLRQLIMVKVSDSASHIGYLSL